MTVTYLSKYNNIARCVMKTLVSLATILMAWISLMGQWSQNAAFPTHIAGGDGEQVLPKTAITSDGLVYVSRFDNATGGNYNVYLQCLNQQGVQQWGQGGVLVSGNPSMSWLTDYDMTVDNAGNAIITFQDIRSAGVNNVFIYKVNPSGTLLWAPDGITLSSDTSTDYANYSPKVLNGSDDHCYVAWQRSGPSNDEIKIHKLSMAGQKLWGENGVTITSAAGEYTWPQLLESEVGDILVKYFVDSGPFWAPTRHVYLARFNSEGILQWTTPVSEAGGISAWNQLFAFESDGAGGAVLAWYDDRNSDMVNEVYVARILADGSLSTPVNGALVTSDTGNQQYYPVITVDTQNQRIFVFFKITDADQNNIGLSRQMLDYSGNRLWGETGTNILPLSSYVASPVHCWLTDLGAVLVYEEGAVPSSDLNMQLKASCYRVGGMSPFEAVPIATNASNKYHFDAATSNGSWTSLMWEEGTSAMDIYGMRINSDGSMGMQYNAPQNLTATFFPPSQVILGWNPPQGTLLPTNYRIFMNNELLQVVAGDLDSYGVEGLSPGTYSFYLVAVYPDDQLSDPSNTAEVTVVSNEDELAPSATLAFTVAPNPVSEQAELSFYCKSAAPLKLSVYNLKGQLVEHFSISPARSGWNSYNWIPSKMVSNGVYFLCLESSKDRVVKKIVRK